MENSLKHYMNISKGVEPCGALVEGLAMEDHLVTALRWVDYLNKESVWFESLPSSIVCVKLKIHDVFFGGLLPNA
jgi:hypothetical protein